MMIRTRYAPSPTGFQHLGSFRTVLFDYLVAKQAEGQFILRIEDTDRARYVPGSVEELLKGLEWLGLTPDEGPYLDEQGHIKERGSYGPYTQSERLPLYHEHLKTLLNNGQAYRCFCTVARLDELRAGQQAAHQAPRYDGHCRTIDPKESSDRAHTEPFVVRHAIPRGQEVVLHDLIRGDISFQSDDLDDYVLLKSDGFPTYQLANVVDDHLMEISHVLRGEEWIPSAPKNLLLYAAFGWNPPAFAHLPLILGEDKAKLSKRHGAEPILAYKEQGYLPEALLNVLAFLGWSPGTEDEFLSLEALLATFRLEKVQKAPAVFSVDRLLYVNGHYLRALSGTELARQVQPYLISSGFTLSDQEYVERSVATIHERMKRLDEAPGLLRFAYFRPSIGEEFKKLIIPKGFDYTQTVEVLGGAYTFLNEYPLEQWTVDALSLDLRAFAETLEIKSGQLLWPLRVALTGEAASPGAFEVLELLGKEESLARLSAAIE